MKNILKAILIRTVFPIVVIALWQISLANSANPFFPPPSKILRSARLVITPEWISTSLTSSLTTLFIGYFIGSVLGVTAGALIGNNPKARIVLTPITNFIRSIPSVAKVPVIMALLGLGSASRVCAVSVAVLFPVLMATMRAVATTSKELNEISLILGFGPVRTLMLVRLPAATGEILAGLHAAVQVALLVMVVSEMLGSGVGVGAFIINSQSTFMIADMWVGILVLGVIGVILNDLFLLSERRIAPWYFKSKENM